MKILCAIVLLSIFALTQSQQVDYCFTVDGGCSNCIGKYEIDYWGSRSDCVWCADGSFSDCDTSDSCYGTVKLDCSVAFDSNAIVAIVLVVAYGLVMLLSLFCVCTAVASSNNARDYQAKYNFSFEGYVRMSDVLPQRICDYGQGGLDDTERNQLIWVGTSVRSDAWKIGCGIAAILPPVVGIIVALIAWLVVGTLIFFISVFIISFMFSLFVLLFASRWRRPPVYVMTPKEAVIIGDNGCGSIVATRFPYRDMPSIDTVQSLDGFGSIYFASRLVRTKHGYRTVRVGFENILNFRKVEAKLKELKQSTSVTTVFMNGQAMTVISGDGTNAVMVNGVPMMVVNGQPMMVQPMMGQPMAQPMMVQPMMGQPMAQPMMGQPMAQPMGQPMAQPMMGQPMAQPMGQPMAQPMSQPAPTYDPNAQTYPPNYSQSPPPYNP